MTLSTEAAMGFRPHTYWTAVVALGGRADAPIVVERVRFDYAGREERFIYHQAAQADPAAAASLIDAARRRCEAKAAAEIDAVLQRLGRRGVAVRKVATAAAVANLPSELGQILRSHALIHAAEGEFGRNLIASACSGLGLEVHRLVEREISNRLRDRLGSGSGPIADRLHAIGAAIGPPWNEDFRLAAQAAWWLLSDPARADA
jgi:hypothetical protein